MGINTDKFRENNPAGPSPFLIPAFMVGRECNKISLTLIASKKIYYSNKYQEGVN